MPASHQVVFVHAPLGQAVFGRHFQPQLAARHSPASGDGRDPPAQFDPGAWQVTASRISWAQEAKKIRLLPRDHHRAGIVRWEHAYLVPELGWRLVLPSAGGHRPTQLSWGPSEQPFSHLTLCQSIGVFWVLVLVLEAPKCLPRLLNLELQEDQRPYCEKSFNQGKLLEGRAGTAATWLSLLRCHHARVPSVATWAVLEEILEFSYTAAFPRLAWVYSSFSLFNKKRGQKMVGSPAGDASPPVPAAHLDFLGFFASLCPHECTNNANQQSCKYVQSSIGAKLDVQLLIVITFYLVSLGFFFHFLFFNLF